MHAIYILSSDKLPVSFTFETLVSSPYSIYAGKQWRSHLLKPQSQSQTLQVTPVSFPDPAGDPSLIPRPCPVLLLFKRWESLHEVLWEAHLPWVRSSYNNGKHGSLYIALLKHGRGLSFPHGTVTTLPRLVSKVNKE